MTIIGGRENLTRAIEFHGPAYLPLWLPLNLDWLMEKDEHKRQLIRTLREHVSNDLLDLNPAMNRDEPKLSNGIWRSVDEWGTAWADDGNGMKTCGYPLQQGYADLATYVFPNPRAEDRFGCIDQQLSARGNRYLVGAVWFTLFERLWMLRGFENLLIDPYLYPQEFAKLRDAVVEFNLAVIDQWLERGADGIFFSDDWGSQRGLLIAPGDWRTYYKRSYARMFRRVRDGGAHVWMHLCGSITAILPDLIDIGLNVLNPVQPQAMDVDHLAREFGGMLCFCGGVDVQGTMVRGTPDDVRREVRHLVDIFGRYNGGYIGATSHSVMPETPLDNIRALYEAFAGYLAH